MTKYIWFLLALTLTACGASARHKALQTAYVSVNTARDGFLAWTESRQEMIVRTASSAEEARRNIDAHRNKQQLVVNYFSVVYEGLALAALEPKEENVAEVLARVRQLHALIKKTIEEGP